MLEYLRNQEPVFSKGDTEWITTIIFSHRYNRHRLLLRPRHLFRLQLLPPLPHRLPHLFRLQLLPLLPHRPRHPFRLSLFPHSLYSRLLLPAMQVSRFRLLSRNISRLSIRFRFSNSISSLSLSISNRSINRYLFQHLLIWLPYISRQSLSLMTALLPRRDPREEELLLSFAPSLWFSSLVLCFYWE